MYVLGIDTSTLVSSVAIVVPDRVVAEFTLHTRKTHSERLMPTIQQMIADADLVPKDITGIAVSIGPGSFTGLRIGITTAKSMAFALDSPVMGVPTLDALAMQFPYSERMVCPILDAQKGNVYTARYRMKNGFPLRVDEYRVMGIAELLQELADAGEAAVITGEVTLFTEYLQAADTAIVQIAPPLTRMPRGAAVATAGYQQMLAGNVQDPRTLTPFYIRRSEAEVLWEQRHGGGDCNGT
jgi:tRNA threonylcarbamoyladenosine biosynthesis protein TsaB